ncbi:phosphatase PAP2 family protein [Rothia kristinae]|nr:phosphatase PAP2 family protein [Rothia kristinae]
MGGDAGADPDPRGARRDPVVLQDPPPGPAPVRRGRGAGQRLGHALKVLVARTRPPTAFMVDGVDRSFSFPSGHTCLFATAALVLAWLLTRGRTRGQRLLAFAVAVLASGTVAASRIYLGYHWLTDVCASLGIAVALLGAVMLIDAALPRGAAASGPSRRRGRVRPARDGAPVPE